MAQYQDAEAGGVEGGGEVDDSAPGGVDGERGDGHVGHSAQEVSHQPRPTPCPAQSAVLAVSHNVKVKGETHVFSQFLQQVYAVAIATLPQVIWQI